MDNEGNVQPAQHSVQDGVDSESEIVLALADGTTLRVPNPEVFTAAEMRWLQQRYGNGGGGSVSAEDIGVTIQRDPATGEEPATPSMTNEFQQILIAFENELGVALRRDDALQLPQRQQQQRVQTIQNMTHIMQQQQQPTQPQSDSLFRGNAPHSVTTNQVLAWAHFAPANQGTGFPNRPTLLARGAHGAYPPSFRVHTSHVQPVVVPTTRSSQGALASNEGNTMQYSSESEAGTQRVVNNQRRRFNRESMGRNKQTLDSNMRAGGDESDDDGKTKGDASDDGYEGDKSS